MELEIVKIVLAGPVGAGKSTAITSLADTPPVSTEMPLTDGRQGNKTTTTVALDFATAILDDGTPLFLYGLPGQDHFSFMRPIVLEGALGALVMLDGRAADVACHCTEWISSIRSIAPGLPMAFGVTHTDMVPGFSIEGVRQAIREFGISVPIFCVDARSRSQMTHLLRAMLVSVE